MERYVVLNKKDFNDFVARLAQDQKVAAPVDKGFNNYSFEEVTSGDQISLKYIPTILPPKKYFMPIREKILEFNKREQKWTPVLEYEKMIVFGVHTCDLAGIQCLNMVFTADPKDINYMSRKDKVAIIGLECNDYCDDCASCKIVDNHLPNGGYDLFFTELDDCFMIHVNTQLGEKCLEVGGLCKEADKEHHKKLKELREKKRTIFKDEVNTTHDGLKKVFEDVNDSKVWEDLEKRCVSCGNCTNVCPTCYCFDVKYDMNLDLNTGCHIRVWDSCQNEEFAKVAGGESFREDRGARQRHRYYRKFKYPLNKFHRYFCTGCGRCTRGCMAEIKLKETINTLIDDRGEK